MENNTFKKYDTLRGRDYIWTIMEVDGDNVLINEQPLYGQPNDFNEVYSYSVYEINNFIKEGILKRE